MRDRAMIRFSTENQRLKTPCRFHVSKNVFIEGRFVSFLCVVQTTRYFNPRVKRRIEMSRFSTKAKLADTTKPWGSSIWPT